MPLDLHDVSFKAGHTSITASLVHICRRLELLLAQVLARDSQHVEHGQLDRGELRVHGGEIILTVEDVEDLDVFIALY